MGEISTAHFERWLALFAETARDVCPPEAAGVFVEFANRMGRGMSAVLRLEAPRPARI